MWWTSHVKKKIAPQTYSFNFNTSVLDVVPGVCGKKKPLWNLKEFFYIDILVEKGVTHDGRTISPRSSEASEGVKWLLQQETGCLFSKQHLITLSVSLLLLSLSFPPLSSFTHYQVYFFLNPQILHSLCRGSVSYKLLLSFFSSLRMLNLLSIEKLFIFQNWTVTPMQMQDWRNLELPLKLQQMTMSSKHAWCKYILKDFVPALIKASSTASTFFFFSRFPFYLS